MLQAFCVLGHSTFGGILSYESMSRSGVQMANSTTPGEAADALSVGDVKAAEQRLADNPGRSHSGPISSNETAAWRQPRQFMRRIKWKLRAVVLAGFVPALALA